MSQSTFIAGALLAGFVLFLAANNRLAVYTAVLWGATTAPTPSGGASGSQAPSAGGGSGDAIGKAANLALDIFTGGSAGLEF